MHHRFSKPLLDWFDIQGRKDLPWQHPRSPYHVWVSEIMLQQTQVKTVIPYFLRFMEKFATLTHLALASEDDVLAHWSGLGYYSRGRNLHKTAKIIHYELNGIFPNELNELVKLPGIGPSTAAAIASLAFNRPTAILDGNVKRILSRYFLVKGPLEKAAIQQKLWQLANECMPPTRCADYTQAIMDLGATCCTPKNPRCGECPLQSTCLAKINNEVANYPNKKSKKPLPTKKQQFLVLHNNGLIYLEKRPPVGLWGGLWCLPCTDIEKCPRAYVENAYRLNTGQMDELIKINHSFSHFHLHIKALALQTEIKHHVIAELSGRWFNLDEISTLGIAKPVQVIIDVFRKLFS